ncbi:cobalt-zinc-cadmium resistance protein [Hylemonella gracilis str. Niagara R]|uniref:Cobalt-zinc-cadmium resistance protein n=1 Tax=Hylemonella gracilis str. Niagara R TaxID=1458275 RepID=A0A016XDA2_9BURK|nr:TolC family protein [Hylemonella gracilis]EYC50049.1 cobalt-zinc-cadmium resistance protein [Hylemonella gracilis str. Niagara R]
MLRKFAPHAMGFALLFGHAAWVQAAVAPRNSDALASALIEAIQPLTLRAAQEQALQGNPELIAARREVEAAEGARIQAGALPNPVLDIQLEDERRATRTRTTSFSQTLELGGKRGARIEAAERAVEMARSRFEAKTADVRAGATVAFFAALVAQDRVNLAQASLEVARRGSEAASKRVFAGKISPIEETKAKVAEAGVRVELVQARGELQSSRQQLLAVMGATHLPAELDGDALNLPQVVAPDAIPGLINDAPALREAQLNVHRLTALVDLESAKRIPDVTLMVGVKRAEELGRDQTVVGISLPLPLFDTNRGALLEALRQRDMAEEELRATELRLRAEASIAVGRYATSVAEVATLKDEVIPGARIAFDAAAKGFELGKFGYLDVLDAQRTLQQARAQYLRALAEVHRAAADLDRLLGSSGSTRSNTLPEIRQ